MSLKSNHLTILVLATLFALPFMTSAHERQVFRVGDKTYLFVVGSLNEPAVVDDKSGVDLRVKLADPKHPEDSSAPHAQPVEGLEKTLKVEVSAGNRKKVFDLEPAYKDPGAYRAVFYPTVATTLQYRIFGTLNDVPVDVAFSCVSSADGKHAQDQSAVQLSDKVSRIMKIGAFGCPLPKSDLGFPEQSTSLYDLGHPSTSHSIEYAALGLAIVSFLIALGAFLRS